MFYIPIPQLTHADIDRFNQKIDQTAGCWLWLSAHDTDGYGLFKIRGTMYKAHRIAYSLQCGTDPQEFMVCHTCDNPPCVNPDHLFLGTQKDNVLDKCLKNRQAKGITHARHVSPETTARGERVNTAKLTETDVRTIIDRLNNGVLRSDLAKAFNVEWTAIDRIMRGKSWKHVPR